MGTQYVVLPIEGHDRNHACHKIPAASRYESNVPDWPGNDNNVHAQSDGPVPGPDCPRAACSIPKYNVSPDATGVMTTMSPPAALAAGVDAKNAIRSKLVAINLLADTH